MRPTRNQDPPSLTAAQTLAAKHIEYAEKRLEILEEKKEKNDNLLSKAETRANAVVDSIGYAGSQLNILNNIFLWLFQVHLNCGTVWFVVFMALIYLFSLGLPIWLAFSKLNSIVRNMDALKEREDSIDKSVSYLLQRVKISERLLNRRGESGGLDTKLSDSIQELKDTMTSTDVTKFKFHYYYYVCITAGSTLVYGLASPTHFAV